MGWQVDVLVNRVVGVRKLIKAGPSSLRGFRVLDENGLRVIRSAYLKIPGSEKYNIQGWAKKTTRLYGRYEGRFGRPDLIMTHSATWAGYAAALIGKRTGIPYLLVEHRSFFVWSTPEARDMVKPYYLPFFQEAYRNCARLVLVSGSLLAGLKSLMPWIGEKTMIIPNMIREDMFLPPSQPRKSDPFVFIWAGRLEHVKGVDLLLKAVHSLKDLTDKSFTVRLAGRGSLRAELEQMARELEVSHLVHFLGRLSREEMQKEMQGANCFVLPTRYEAFGAVLIEALATGLPLIATRSGGPDTIVTAENGLLTDVESLEQLTGAMEHMINYHRAYSSERIRADALERYGQSVIMKQYHHLFLRLLGE